MNSTINAVTLAAHLQSLIAQGTRWAASGDDPLTGCSCYGLVRYAYRQTGLTLPETPEEGQAVFTPVSPPYQPWDVLLWDFSLWRGQRHLALLLAGGQGYHCSSNTNGLARFRLTDAVVQRVLRGGWRYKGDVCI